MRLLLAPVLALAGALALVGCGGSSTGASQTVSSVDTSTQAPAPATNPATESTPASTTSTPATSTSTPATPGMCRAADLTASYLGGQAATGHGLLGFALQNVSGHTCTTFGYPGIQFLSQSAEPLPTVPNHTTTDFFGSLPERMLSVAPGATVSFRLGVTHGAASTAGCTTAYLLQVIPPNDTATLRIALPGGAYECQTATVSPMQPGTSAYP
ncbi:MAG TPA: DUF4232 domain-containing protein [Solirubrobacteraceae bacterium]|nr:DUF4232 domain-containing protein [Solirubrobacteraceae bacterium]